jgi:hypothetical protein
VLANEWLRIAHFRRSSACTRLQVLGSLAVCVVLLGCVRSATPERSAQTVQHPLRVRLADGFLELDGAKLTTLDARSGEQTAIPSLASALQRRRKGRLTGAQGYAFEVSDRATNAQVWRVLRTLAEAGWPSVEVVRQRSVHAFKVPTGTAAARLPPVDRGLYVALGAKHRELVWLEDDEASTGPLNVLERHLTDGPIDELLRTACDEHAPACRNVTVDADPLGSADALFELLALLERAEPSAPPPLLSLFLDGPVSERPRPERYQIAHPRLVRLTAESIQGVLRAAFPRFQKCYADGLARNQRLRGTVTLDFYIRRDGQAMLSSDAVARASSLLGGGERELRPEQTRFEPMQPSHAPDELPDELVKACAHWVVTTLKFPRPRGGSVYVTYPLPLRPE